MDFSVGTFMLKCLAVDRLSEGLATCGWLASTVIPVRSTESPFLALCCLPHQALSRPLRLAMFHDTPAASVTDSLNVVSNHHMGLSAGC